MFLSSPCAELPRIAGRDSERSPPITKRKDSVTNKFPDGNFLRPPIPHLALLDMGNFLLRKIRIKSKAVCFLSPPRGVRLVLPAVGQTRTSLRLSNPDECKEICFLPAYKKTAFAVFFLVRRAGFEPA